tara:strand:+ start:373 stop:519 length:147 start_codon:yes stop_codon:yes gene_type:complete
MYESPIKVKREWDRNEFFREQLQKASGSLNNYQDREYNNSNFSVNMFD